MYTCRTPPIVYKVECRGGWEGEHETSDADGSLGRRLLTPFVRDPAEASKLLGPASQHISSDDIRPTFPPPVSVQFRPRTQFHRRTATPPQCIKGHSLNLVQLHTRAESQVSRMVSYFCNLGPNFPTLGSAISRATCRVRHTPHAMGGVLGVARESGAVHPRSLRSRCSHASKYRHTRDVLPWEARE